MAFTTLSGSDGITSLVGSTGVDTATLVTLNENVFVGGNTGNDTLTTLSGTGNVNSVNFTVRMGGGNDGVVLNDNLVNSTVTLDGEVLANDGNDVFNNSGTRTVNSTIRGLGGNDIIGLGSLETTSVNGNTGNDNINSSNVGGVQQNTTLSSATVLGGQGNDIVNLQGDGSSNILNGNRGNDVVTLTGGAQGTIAVTTLFGGQGNDIVTLANNNIDGNTISGDLGNDVLTGAASNDILLGGDGADTIVSAGGADTLTGGDGVDTYTIGNNLAVNLNGTTDNFATISDFNAGAGETITVNTLGGAKVGTAIKAFGNVATTSNTDLFTNLVALGNFDNTNTIATVNLTAGAAGAQFAGSYILVQNAKAAAAFSADDVAIAADITGLVNADVIVV